MDRRRRACHRYTWSPSPADAPLPPIARDSTLADADIRLVRAAERARADAIEAVMRVADASRVRRSRTAAGCGAPLPIARTSSSSRRQRIAELAAPRRRPPLGGAGGRAQASRRDEQLGHLAGVPARARAGCSPRSGDGIRLWYGAIQASCDGAAGMPDARPSRPSAPGRDRGPPIALPEFADSEVSLVIPVRSRAPTLTLACLQSIRDHTPDRATR